jgi:anti-anti-sigma regulatory factor
VTAFPGDLGAWGLAGTHASTILGFLAAGGALYAIRRGIRRAESCGIAVRQSDRGDAVTGPAASVAPGIQIYTAGNLFELDIMRFAQTVLPRVAESPATLVVCLESLTIVDTRALHSLRELLRRSRAEGTLVLFCGLKRQPRAALGRSGLLDELGPQNLVPDLKSALRLAAQRVDPRL